MSSKRENNQQFLPACIYVYYVKNIYLIASCGGVARENGTYFVNPNHPETTDGTGSCQLTILKLHPEICQIRLDFEQFALAGKLNVQTFFKNNFFFLLILQPFLHLHINLFFLPFSYLKKYSLIHSVMTQEIENCY